MRGQKLFIEGNLIKMSSSKRKTEMQSKKLQYVMPDDNIKGKKNNGIIG